MVFGRHKKTSHDARSFVFLSISGDGWLELCQSRGLINYLILASL